VVSVSDEAENADTSSEKVNVTVTEDEDVMVGLVEESTSVGAV
jgi:hypothetical protein